MFEHNYLFYLNSKPLMKEIFLLISLAFSINAIGQNTLIGIPDSAKNISKPDSME